ncbi:MAG: hypothetical protein V2A73_12500, partial [Pseudomonadota bacterium]
MSFSRLLALTFATVPVVAACGLVGDNIPGPRCTDECSAGSQSCAGDDGFVLCGQYDLDPCLEVSPPVACALGEQCLYGGCAPACQDECPTGMRLCAGEASVLVCGNFDLDVCRELGGNTICPDGTRCEVGDCVPLSRQCNNECAAASNKECFGDAVRTCGQHDGDPCLDFGPPAVCEQGKRCRSGVCDDACKDECLNEGANQCVGDAVRSCGRTRDGCLQWGPPVACTAGLSCSEGRCSGACSDECASKGTMVCTPAGDGLSSCGQYDSDECLDRATPIPCPHGSVCTGSVCASSCTDGCVLGEPPRCAYDGEIVETCGNFDDDACSEWGGAVPCPNGASCSQGACQIDCNDECPTAGVTECVAAANASHTCGQWDADPCLDWSAASACAGWEVCEEAECTLGPTPGTVLVDEVAFDSTGEVEDGVDAAGDCAGNGLFIELWGPAGLALDGYEVVGIDGADGSVYARIGLDGKRLASDGSFLIAHPAAKEELRNSADLTSAAADFQDGPDSIQVRWHGRTVDALGYGDFATSDVFAGEGTPIRVNANAGGEWQSLTRDASHSDQGDNATDFSLVALPLPGRTPTCSHQCPAVGRARCQGALLQTCVADLDDDFCREWSAPQACPGTGEVCKADACMVSCPGSCPASGVTTCAGTQVMTCGNFDDEPCLEWSPPADCQTGESCVGSSCRPTAAPEVVLITPQGFVQSTQGRVHRILVDATASSGRTISEVSYYANGVLLGTTTGVPHEHFYAVPKTAATGSLIVLQAKAVDSTGASSTSGHAFLDIRNDYPLASFTATIANAKQVTVDASSSRDSETPTAKLEICWDWDADGTCDPPSFATNKIASHVYADGGVRRLRVQVRDEAGQISEAEQVVDLSAIQYVGNTTLASTTWFGTVVLTGDVVVGAGATLTIAPGTNVLFSFVDEEGSGSGQENAAAAAAAAADGRGDCDLIVEGTLVANGAAGTPVVFSGKAPDAKRPGGWGRIVLAGTAPPSSLRHVIVEHGQLVIANASTLTNITVRQAGSDCIVLSSAKGASLNEVTVTSCAENGIEASGGASTAKLERVWSTENGASGMAILD